MATAGDKDVLTISTPLTGKLNVTGSLSSKATGALGEALGELPAVDAAVEKVLRDAMEPQEAEDVLKVVIEWARHGEVFEFDFNTGMIHLSQD